MKKKSKLAIDLSGLSETSRWNLENALKTERTVVNMNYPPKDMPEEELQRFWGEPDPKDDKEFVKRMRAIKAKKKYKPSPV